MLSWESSFSMSVNSILSTQTTQGQNQTIHPCVCQWLVVSSIVPTNSTCLPSTVELNGWCMSQNAWNIINTNIIKLLFHLWVAKWQHALSYVANMGLAFETYLFCLKYHKAMHTEYIWLIYSYIYIHNWEESKHALHLPLYPCYSCW